MSGCTGEVGMVEGHGPIDQCNRDLRPALGVFHQYGHPDQIERIHRAPRIDRSYAALF